jgi:hypothetical protein
VTFVSLKLFAQCKGERVQKRLGAVVNRLKAARDKASNRARDQSLALTHVVADLVDQIDSAGDIGVDHQSRSIEILIEKATPKASAGVRQQRIDGTAFDRRLKLIDSFSR